MVAVLTSIVVTSTQQEKYTQRRLIGLLLLTTFAWIVAVAAQASLAFVTFSYLETENSQFTFAGLKKQFENISGIARCNSFRFSIRHLKI